MSDGIKYFQRERYYDDKPKVSKLSEVELLRAQLKALQSRNKQLEEAAFINSWRDNPDRMGGSFTEDEKNDSGWR